MDRMMTKDEFESVVQNKKMERDKAKIELE